MSAFPDRSELVARYATAGFDLSHLPWYEASALCRLAVVLQQLFRRFETDQSKEARPPRFPEAIPRLLEGARSALVVAFAARDPSRANLEEARVE